MKVETMFGCLFKANNHKMTQKREKLLECEINRVFSLNNIFCLIIPGIFTCIAFSSVNQRQYKVNTPPEQHETQRCSVWLGLCRSWK